MSQSLKFPPTVEIKRVIAAAGRAGIEIGSVEIQPRKITIHSREPTDEGPAAAYARWRASQGKTVAKS